MYNRLSASFLWIYPLLFTLDASLSVVDDVTSYFLPVKMLSSVREIYATIIYFMSLLYIFNNFFYKLEKNAPYWLCPFYNVVFSILSTINFAHLLSETSLFSIMAFEMSPHYIYIKHTSFFIFQLLASIAQLIIGLYCFKHTWIFRDKVEKVNLKFFKASAASSMFVFVFLICNIVTVVTMFITSSSGFIELVGNKIVSVEKVYVKDDKTIHLIPMVHIGSENFYKELSKLDVNKKTLVLLEGVRDEKNLMNEISYRKIATTMGLSSQEEKFEPKAKTKELQKNISYIVADIDASEFSPETRKFINQIMKNMNDKSFFELLLSGHDLEGFSGDLSFVSVDIIEKRNQKVLLDLENNKLKYDDFYVPWGAAHLPEIEKEIQKQGYVVVSRKKRTIASLDEVIQKFSANSSKSE